MRIKLGLVAISALIGLTATIANAQQRSLNFLFLRNIDGQARLIGFRNKDLGLVSSDKSLADSICRSPKVNSSNSAIPSIWNRLSPYGDRISNTSAYNPKATQPPTLVLKNGSAIYVSKNPNIFAIDPDVIYKELCR
ncbi:hypothetical protein IQ264_02795 [Phormidium sp. LEGE 05292]|uniref:hypothetical protein n=1 Tax=[Phormidium] sp. LEGE 05292 TaxID=767427 RepID=UPI001880D75B|nr:hypothetical protein [Phormidium sp. LEGE 05292]MBE9224402.1 hypothetical protein [Phormidium sp. LEGE 05292]